MAQAKQAKQAPAAQAAAPQAQAAAPAAQAPAQAPAQAAAPAAPVTRTTQALALAQAAQAANKPTAAAMLAAAQAGLPPSLVVGAGSAGRVPTALVGKQYRINPDATPKPQTHNAVWWAACVATLQANGGTASAAALAQACASAQPASPKGGHHSVNAYIKRQWLVAA